MADRRRNTLVLLIVLGLALASLAVIASKPTRLGLDLKGGVQLIYQGRATAQAKVDTESLNRAIDIMRKRVDQLGVAQPEIKRSGGTEITVSLPSVTNARRAQEQVGKTAQLFFYDWEPNVIGPNGQPAPSEGDGHGRSEPRVRGSRAARVRSGAARAQAPGDHPQERHDLRGGLHAQAGEGVHLRPVVPARRNAQKGVARTRGHRSEPLRRNQEAAQGRRRRRRCA